jgi:hypothetical protein
MTLFATNLRVMGGTADPAILGTAEQASLGCPKSKWGPVVREANGHPEEALAGWGVASYETS